MKPLILTMGEPAGIGAEIAAGAWRALRASGPCFALIDDAGRDFGVPVARIAAPEEAGAVFAQALPILHRPLAVPVVPGNPSPAHASAVIAAIEEAVALAKSGRAAGVVTNPIQKASLTAAGFPHPGHTEFLGELAGLGAPPVMMLGGILAYRWCASRRRKKRERSSRRRCPFCIGLWRSRWYRASQALPMPGR